MDNAEKRIAPLVRLGALLLFFSFATPALYFFTNSNFARFDDEGFFISALRFFGDGRSLYADIYSNYGPVYFWYERAFFSIFHLTPDQDGIRWGALFSALSGTALLGAVIARNTGSLTAAIAGCYLIFSACLDFGSIPGHPQESMFLVFATSVFFVSSQSSDSKRDNEYRLAIVLGAASAALIGSKINNGIVFLAGSGVFLLSNGLAGALSRPLRYCLLGMILVVPIGITGGSLATAFKSPFVGYLVICLLMAWKRQFGDGIGGSFRPLRAGLLFGLIAFAGIGSIVYLLRAGGLAWDLILYGLLTQHIGAWSGVEVLPEWSLLPVELIILSIALFYLARAKKIDESGIFVLRFIYGLLILCAAFSHQIYIAFLVGVGFIWLALPSGETEIERPKFKRLQTFLAWQSVFYALLLYPRMLTSIPSIPLVVMALHTCAWSLPQIIKLPSPAWRLLRSSGISWATTLVCLFSFAILLRGTYNGYARLTPLALPGSGRLRLESGAATDFRKVAKLLNDRADGFITVPGMNSFHLWSKIPPITGFNYTVWPGWLPISNETAIEEKFKQLNHPIVVWDQNLLEWWGIPKPKNSPLIALIQSEFCETKRVGDFRILERRANGAALCPPLPSE